MSRDVPFLDLLSGGEGGGWGGEGESADFLIQIMSFLRTIV